MMLNDEEKKCFICGSEIIDDPLSLGQTYTADFGISITVPNTIGASAFAATSKGKVWICDQCYPSAASQKFSGNDLAEIHFQFGLDFYDRGNLALARKCFLNAITINRRPAYLSSLANITEDKKARELLYEEAMRET